MSYIVAFIKHANGRLMETYEIDGDKLVRRRYEDVCTAIEKLPLRKRLSDQGKFMFLIEGFEGQRSSDKTGHRILLTRVAAEGLETKVKVFGSATSLLGCADSIINHLWSLTDDLCSQWFNEREKKVKAKKTA